MAPRSKLMYLATLLLGGTPVRIIWRCLSAAGLHGPALVDFSDQITKIYHQGASMAQLTFEQPCGGHHAFEHRDEMRRNRILGRY